MKRILFLLLVLSAGCATQSFGSGASGAHPPPLPPGAAVPMWDHFCSQVVGRQAEVSRYLDEASENGWELVSWSIAERSNLACFKRPRLAAAPGGAPLLSPGAAPPAAH
jgi:hypothetical protein